MIYLRLLYKSTSKKLKRKITTFTILYVIESEQIPSFKYPSFKTLIAINTAKAKTFWSGNAHIEKDSWCYIHEVILSTRFNTGRIQKNVPTWLFWAWIKNEMSFWNYVGTNLVENHQKRYIRWALYICRFWKRCDGPFSRTSITITWNFFLNVIQIFRSFFSEDDRYSHKKNVNRKIIWQTGFYLHSN